MLLACVVVLLSGSVLGFIAWQVWNDRASTLAQSTINAENLSRSLAQHASRTIEAADRVLIDLAERVEHDGFDENAADRLNRLLSRYGQAAPHLRQFLIFDETGRLVASTLPAGAALSAVTRPYFVYHRDHPDAGLHIEGPLRGRLTKQWLMSVSRRVNHPDGSFAGVVASGINVDYFQRFYETFDVGAHGTIALATEGGIILARQPDIDDDASRDMSKQGAYRAWASSDALVGTVQVTSPFDGLTKWITYSRVEDYPLLVTVGEAEDEILAAWRVRADRELAVGAGVALGILVLGWILITVLRRREQAQEELQRERAVLQESIDALPDGFVLYDHDTRVRMSNRRYREIRAGNPAAYQPGLEFETSLRHGLDSGDLVLPPDTDQEDWLAQRVQQLRAGATDVVRHLQNRWYRVVERRTPTGRIVSIHSDITALKEAQVAAEAANRAKSVFLARMSHELRTPLNAVIGFAQMLAGKPQPSPEKQLEYARAIESSGAHLLGLVNDLLDLAGIEAGQPILSLDSVAVGPLLDEVRTTMLALALRSKVRLDVNVEPGLPEVRGNHMRLRQVLFNLASNAVKYGGTGAEVHLSAAAAPDGRVRLTVTDTGPGIAPEMQRHLFEPFHRLGAEYTTTEGTGIGLAIAKRLVEAMGGKIGFASTPGQGSCFWVELLGETAAERRHRVARSVA
jgi:signal transduction histidine kinase